MLNFKPIIPKLPLSTSYSDSLFTFRFVKSASKLKLWERSHESSPDLLDVSDRLSFQNRVLPPDLSSYNYSQKQYSREEKNLRCSPGTQRNSCVCVKERERENEGMQVPSRSVRSAERGVETGRKAVARMSNIKHEASCSFVLRSIRAQARRSTRKIQKRHVRYYVFFDLNR